MENGIDVTFDGCDAAAQRMEVESAQTYTLWRISSGPSRHRPYLYMVVPLERALTSGPTGEIGRLPGAGDAGRLPAGPATSAGWPAAAARLGRRVGAVGVAVGVCGHPAEELELDGLRPPRASVRRRRRRRAGRRLLVAAGLEGGHPLLDRRALAEGLRVRQPRERRLATETSAAFCATSHDSSVFESDSSILEETFLISAGFDEDRATTEWPSTPRASTPGCPSARQQWPPLRPCVECARSSLSASRSVCSSCATVDGGAAEAPPPGDAAFCSASATRPALR